MSGFKFERNLSHQRDAVSSVLKVFDGVASKASSNPSEAKVSNPLVQHKTHMYFGDNIQAIHKSNEMGEKVPINARVNIIDVMMETGTGKSYTYTKMMFELQKQLGVSKFIVVVPTLSIKAGTVNFLKAKATKEHFRQEYNCNLKTYVVESKKSNKKKKEYMPQAVREFVEANSFGAKSIHVLIINAGMINSDTMSKAFDVNLFDKYNTPFKAIASLKPFTIVDEPHKFATANKTWKNIEKLQSQFIIRYGATFNNDFKNLVYRLSAVDAFNQNLVKGVVAYIEEFEEGKNIALTLKSTDGKEAHFELNISGKKTKHKLIKKATLSKIDASMHDLYIENMNKTKVILSNGLELTKNSSINPYSYDISLQDRMIEKVVKKHFELERELLNRTVKIKPLTLFFIDDIEGYRDGNNLAGSLKSKFETICRGHITKLLQSEKEGFYREYLEKSLKDISLIHGGYFSKDNSQKDEQIEKEINEILHDKESLLSLGNVRRFIFSKWTLREGWDNPNVFQICKLRSSGSVTSKLQEVGRGLRLPVNEYMSRVKEESFDLHYYVDFSEKDFVASLVEEINEKSGTINEENIPTKLNKEIIDKIVEKYPIEEDNLLEMLDSVHAIKRNNDFKEGGYEILKALYPEAFESGLKRGKVRSCDKEPQKTTIRAGKYAKLKELWERINQKVVLEYRVEHENDFFDLLKGYFIKYQERFQPQGVSTTQSKLEFEDSIAFYQTIESIEDEILAVVTMDYKSFLLELSMVLSVNMQTLHQVFVEIRDKLDINLYRNMQTIRAIRIGFNRYLLENAFSHFSVGYSKVSNTIHPTKLTYEDGTVRDEVGSSDLGIKFAEEETANSYLFEELYFDSDLEKENISKEIAEVTVFTKIPKNSIRIPVAGGGTYSPDFAYVVKDKKGAKSLNLVVETKNTLSENLREEERQKIKFAQELFANLDNEVKVVFKKQFKGERILDVIQKALRE